MNVLPKQNKRKHTQKPKAKAKHNRYKLWRHHCKTRDTRSNYRRFRQQISYFQCKQQQTQRHSVLQLTQTLHFDMFVKQIRNIDLCNWHSIVFDMSTPIPLDHVAAPNTPITAFASPSVTIFHFEWCDGYAIVSVLVFWALIYKTVLCSWCGCGVVSSAKVE